jgi:NAD(P)-dependent dehydrogenase (short-subunit alcohol dehydrogenase family)
MTSETLPSSPSFSLTGKRALVTGASRGIGLAAAAALASAGAHVTLNARDGSDLRTAAEAIRSRGGQAEIAVSDVTDISAFSDYVRQSQPFDIFVNNAGMNRPKPFVDVRPEDFDAVMGLNLRAAFFAAQAIVRRMLEAGAAGSIINMSSQMGHVGAENRSIYCASKFALEGLTKAMAIELGPSGIRVNTICPTFVQTPMTRPFFENAEFLEKTLAKIKLGRLGQPEDITGAVIFLASAASSLMTGASLLIDGGWTAD